MTTPPSEASRVRRHPERASYEHTAAHAILDEGLVAHVGFVAQSRPFVIPMVYARVGATLYLHGAPVSRPLQADQPLCVTVTLLDGLVFARSAFSHSMNYRSVVVQGLARAVTEEAEKRLAFDALLEHVSKGRAAVARPANPKELAGTAVVALPLADFAVKQRKGGPLDPAEDRSWPVWAGVVPLALQAGAPKPAEGVAQLTPPTPRR
jgi:hypothetical protein